MHASRSTSIRASRVHRADAYVSNDGLSRPGRPDCDADKLPDRSPPTAGSTPTLRNLDGTWNGEGIGHWEGDTIVIDTIGFNSSSWFDQLGGYFHSENMHVVERLHRDGNTLTWTATVDDSDVLLKPWTTTPRVGAFESQAQRGTWGIAALQPARLVHAATKEHHEMARSPCRRHSSRSRVSATLPRG